MKADEILSNVDVGLLLNCKPDTARKWSYSGRIPSHKVGNKIIFLKTEILAWIKKQPDKRTPNKELKVMIRTDNFKNAVRVIGSEIDKLSGEVQEKITIAGHGYADLENARDNHFKALQAHFIEFAIEAKKWLLANELIHEMNIEGAYKCPKITFNNDFKAESVSRDERWQELDELFEKYKKVDSDFGR